MIKISKRKVLYFSFLVVFLLMICEFKNDCLAQIPVYRFYNDALKTHLYSTDENEKAHLEADGGWRYEGVAWYAYATQEAGTLPVYRFYSAATASHLYTMDENEKTVLMPGSAYQYEGVAYYAYSAPSESDRPIYRLYRESTIPVYRLYSEVLRRHLFTTDANEAAVLDDGPNWNGEGIAWYVWSGDSKPPPIASAKAEAICETVNNELEAGVRVSFNGMEGTHSYDISLHGPATYKRLKWEGLSCTLVIIGF